MTCGVAGILRFHFCAMWGVTAMVNSAFGSIQTKDPRPGAESAFLSGFGQRPGHVCMRERILHVRATAYVRV